MVAEALLGSDRQQRVERPTAELLGPVQADPAGLAHGPVARARVAVRGHALEGVLILAGKSHGQLHGEAVGARRDFTE